MVYMDPLPPSYYSELARTSAEGALRAVEAVRTVQGLDHVADALITDALNDTDSELERGAVRVS